MGPKTNNAFSQKLCVESVRATELATVSAFFLIECNHLPTFSVDWKTEKAGEINESFRVILVSLCERQRTYLSRLQRVCDLSVYRGCSCTVSIIILSWLLQLANTHISVHGNLAVVIRCIFKPVAFRRRLGGSRQIRKPCLRSVKCAV